MTSKKGTVLGPFEHALHRPDAYIGSVKTTKCEKWVWDFEEGQAVRKKINFNRGLFNMIREIGSNVIDNKWRSEQDPDSPAMKKIVITVDQTTGRLTFWNDGYCIPVRKEEYTFKPFKKEAYTMKLYPSEVFFGQMGAGTNFDDTQERKTSGRNGMGSKLTNIFSTEFVVEHVSPEDKAKFFQKHWKNGSKSGEKKITKSTRKVGYTQISFIPDYGYFGYPRKSDADPAEVGLDDELVGIVKMYAYEIAMITGLSVAFKRVRWVDHEVKASSEERLSVKNLEQYARLFYPDKTQNKMARFTTEAGDECVVVESNEIEADTIEKVTHVSFVNGLQTSQGGIHVDEWESMIVTSFVKFFNARKPKKGEKKALKVTGKEVKPYLTFFLRIEVDKPVFGTQTKEELTGPEYKVPRTKNIKEALAKTFKQMLRWNFIFLLEEKLLAKADRSLSKTENSRRKVTAKGVTEANKAGTKESHKCVLCITEGLSAKAFADRGIGSIKGQTKDGRETSGHDYYGTMAVRGKFMNVQNSSVTDINDNVEIQLLKKVLGLRHGVDYSQDKNFKTLKYGKVWILTDADDDGIHIRGLIINFFYRAYPQLVERKYIEAFNTAVVRASSGSAKKRKHLLFYSNPEFREWFTSGTPKPRGLDIKYYKGLGSINPKDAPGYFKNPKVVTYFVEGDEDQYMDLGFNGKSSDERKLWITRDMSRDSELNLWLNKALSSGSGSSSEFDLDDSDCELNLDPEDALDPSENIQGSPDFVYEGELSLSCFVDQQLIIYHRMALRRCLPGIWDGLKEGQRKILFTLRRLKYKKTRDLEKVSGAVKETGYHHGAVSLQQAIIKMGQGYVGSNNIPLLVNDGEFGCVDPTTPILLWNGKIKKAEEVVVGDVLIGDDGRSRTVKSLTNGEDEMYDVRQGFGDTYRVNSCHILTLRYSGHKTIGWKKSTNSWTVTYFDPQKMRPRSRSASVGRTSHFNSSKLTREEARGEIEEFAKTIPDEWEVFDIDIQTYLSLPESTKYKLKGVKNSKIVSWEKKDIPIDPYIFGLWLGDGNRQGRGFATEDPEVVKAWVKWTDTIGVEVVHYKNGENHENYSYGLRRRGTKMNGRNRNMTAIGSTEHSSKTCIGCLTSSVKHPACDWTFEGKNDKSSRCYDYQNKNGVTRDDYNPFIVLLKNNKLFKNKHIPEDYITNDKETRLKLLAGFIDSDGTVRQSRGVQHVVISQEETTHGHLIDSVQYIARSLGFRAEVGTRICKRKNGKHSVMKELSITGEIHDIPTRVARKKLKIGNRERNRMCCAIEVIPVGKGKFVGWEIDGNERFLLGDFTITHNTRAQGGKDAAQARYPSTMLEEIAWAIFPEVDDALLERLVEDNEEVEFSTFMPVIPMLLVNGANGIASGYSTDIPCYNPLDLVKWIEVWLDGSNEVQNLRPLKPWYRGFKGEIELVRAGDSKTPKGWISKGILEKDTKKNKGWWHIRELPIGMWTKRFEEWLEYLESGTIPKGKRWKKAEIKCLSAFKHHHTANTVHFMIKPTKEFIPDMTVSGNLKNMQKSRNLENMVAIDERDFPYRFSTPEEILECFCRKRLGYYSKRKEYLLALWNKDLLRAKNRYRFVKAVGIDRKLDLHNFEEDEDLFEEMASVWKFARIDDSFDYLLGMQVRSLTRKKAESLKEERVQLNKKISNLKSKSPEDLWKGDLAKFKAAYKKFQRTRREE